MKTNLESALKTAHDIKRTQYPDSDSVLLAGSTIRGEGTRYSDLDLVVVYAELDAARRESFHFEGFPVEAFIHTEETLKYFFEDDARRGIPSLPQMVSEGIAIPESPLTLRLKKAAEEILGKGPLPLSDLELRNSRYIVTDLVDDLREPRSHAETVATAARLYELLADFQFRANGKWSARGKTIPRKLGREFPDLALRFEESFREAFATGVATRVIELASELLGPHRGFLFDGYSLTAPKEWRK